MLRTALAAGIAPEAFWRLSVREWRALGGGGEGLGAAGLRELMAQYPDHSVTKEQKSLGPRFRGDERGEI